MKQSNKTEAAGVDQNELLVGTAIAPVIRHEKKREAVEQHNEKAEQAEPKIELSDMPPQIIICIYRSIFNTGTQTNKRQ